MTKLSISIGQSSDKGIKNINQDYYSLCIPKEPLLSTKGIAVALADGISSSDVSQVASEAAVKSFLSDYYCTPESWSVRQSIQRVISSINSWLYAQTRQSRYRFESKDRGYVCTFSALIIKSNTAHIFNVGDTRIYRLVNNSLEQLTEDHRLWISDEKSYLSRALGVQERLEIDYRTISLSVDDVFILATDGVYEFVAEKTINKIIKTYNNDLNHAASNIIEQAYQNGSKDNVTIQIVNIDQLPAQNSKEIYQLLNELPFPPVLEARKLFDGYKIIRDIYSSSRSHVHLAIDTETQQNVIIKTPSIENRNDDQYMERFLMEEWIARRIDNAHVLKSHIPTRKRNYLYIVTEYIDGMTLAQWLIDQPQSDLETVRSIIEQIAKGLQSLHRQEMIHQDLRPNNIMIDKTGCVKIIDFGSTKVAGLQETTVTPETEQILGTALYTAPEYFIGEQGTKRSDLFSLGVITYQMLSGKFPYGTNVSKAQSRTAQNKLTYTSLHERNVDVPYWIDESIKKAVHPNPLKRYQHLSEFIYDLRHPNKTFRNKSHGPLIEKNPILFWKMLSLVLFIILLFLLGTHPSIK